MRKVLERRFAVLLAVVMVVSCVPEAVFAADTEAAAVQEEDARTAELEKLSPKMEMLGEDTEETGKAVEEDGSEEDEQTEKLGEASVREEEVDAVGAYSGTCGENLTWTLDNNGALTISGTGEMNNYNANSAPWKNLGFTTVIINDGVTNIGSYAFESCSALAEIVIPNSIETIGDKAFSECSNLAEIVIPSSTK